MEGQYLGTERQIQDGVVRCASWQPALQKSCVLVHLPAWVNKGAHHGLAERVEGWHVAQLGSKITCCSQPDCLSGVEQLGPTVCTSLWGGGCASGDRSPRHNSRLQARSNRGWSNHSSLRTFTRRDTPAVAKNSSSRSKAVEHTMSGAARPSPYFRFAATLWVLQHGSERTERDGF